MSEISMPRPAQRNEPPRVSRPLWLAVCESVVGRRRRATEALAIVAAVYRARVTHGADAEPHHSPDPSA